LSWRFLPPGAYSPSAAANVEVHSTQIKNNAESLFVIVPLVRFCSSCSHKYGIDKQCKLQKMFFSCGWCEGLKHSNFKGISLICQAATGNW
jgi:hypothetical protein